MKALTLKTQALLAAILIAVGCLFAASVAHADGSTDAEVSAVIAQLEVIDTLQEMQDARANYTASGYYDTTTTDADIIAAHEAARAGYEEYVSTMSAARLAAKQAYEALSAEQQAQISDDLVAKIYDSLSTYFRGGTYPVTPRSDEYAFEAVDAWFGAAYEVSDSMVAGNIPQTFILVDTSDGKTEWTPNGTYAYGQSNYEVLYCCDVETGLEYGTDYKRVNLEDSSYYGPNAARHVRAILENAYPFVTIDEMKASLKAGGLNADYVDSLTRGDLIAAVQMSIWAYANGVVDGSGYFASIDVTRNTGIYFTPLHDYTNESWDWYPGKRQRSYDAEAAYRVNNLIYYLCNLPGVDVSEDQIVVSDIEIARADLLAGSNNTYSVGMYVHINGGDANDDLKITVSSYSTSEDGSTVLTGRSSQQVTGEVAEMSVRAKVGDTIEVKVEGTQYLPKGVYLYEPEGGRKVSQTLVSVGEGETNVGVVESFVFEEDVSMGLRIYKTAYGTGLPLSGITFSVYKAVPGEGEVLSEVPGDAEVERYATAENLVGSVVTDATGYAAIALEQGTYLVIEEHNALKVKEPIDPFYVSVPMVASSTTTDEGTEVETTLVDVISVYPKNEPVEEAEEDIISPEAPDNVTGFFSIVKHDAADTNLVLSGAEFAVYRPATEEDETVELHFCNGMECAMVPVMVDGARLVLTTGEDGTATSPQLTCGTYYLVETKAPDGYYSLEEAVSVWVSSDTIVEKEPVYIANQKGALLPSTGGAGTVGLYVVGGILVVVAAILLVTRRRSNGGE